MKPFSGAELDLGSMSSGPNSEAWTRGPAFQMES